MFTAWKVSVFEVFGLILVRIFPHSDWIRRDTEFSNFFSNVVSSLNILKYEDLTVNINQLEDPVLRAKKEIQKSS